MRLTIYVRNKVRMNIYVFVIYFFMFTLCFNFMSFNLNCIICIFQFQIARQVNVYRCMLSRYGR